MPGKKITVTLTKSAFGHKPALAATLKALGLRKPRAERSFTDSKALHGMIAKVSHLVEVREG